MQRAKSGKSEKLPKNRAQRSQEPFKMADYEDDLNKTIDRYKWVVLIFNILSLILGVATFSVCIWIRIDLDFWEWVVEIDWYSYW